MSGMKLRLVLIILLITIVMGFIGRRAYKNFQEFEETVAYRTKEVLIAACDSDKVVEEILSKYEELPYIFDNDSSIKEEYVHLTLTLCLGLLLPGLIFSIGVYNRHKYGRRKSDKSGLTFVSEEEFKKNLEQKVQSRTAELVSEKLKLEKIIKDREKTNLNIIQNVQGLDSSCGLLKLLDSPEASLNDIFQSTLILIRAVHRNPLFVSVRICFDGVFYNSDNFQKSPYSQYTTFVVDGRPDGEIEMYYNPENSEQVFEPFNEKEISLLKDFSRRLSRVVEIKRAGEKLQLFRSLMEQSHDCILILEGTWGRILDANNTACRILGFSREELLLRTIDKICEEKVYNFITSEHLKSLKTEAGVTIRSEIQMEQGNYVYLESALRRVEHNGYDYVIAVARDITDHVKHEAELARRKRNLETTFDATPVGMLLLDRNLKVRRLNDSIRNLFQRTGVAKTICSFKCLCNESIAESEYCPACKLRKIAQLALNTDTAVKGVDIEITVDNSDKDEAVWISVNAEPADIDGAKHVILAVQDITDRHKAEQIQAKLLNELASVNKELKEYAYIVSHDLKAPLRGIKTLADWLINDYSDQLGESGKEQMLLLCSRVDRMHNLIDGILQYSRIGNVHEKVSKIDLNEMVSDVLDMIHPPKNVEVSVEGKLPEITAEPTRVQQVFQNLISNAIKYMDKPQGQISIGCIDEGDFWQFHVTDNGPGIDPKYYERIFGIFQTLSSRDEFESTGIGLAVVKKIVELYGGRIWIASQLGQGCTFNFTMPKCVGELKYESVEINSAG